LRTRTGLPVTTTEEAINYDEVGEPRLALLSDWLFPDVHLSLEGSDETLSEGQISSEVADLMSRIRKVELLARRLHRPLMLKMLSFPHGCVQGATPELQRLFFRRMINQLRDTNSGLRVNATFMVDGAFDQRWKSGGRYYSWDACTGLIGDNGQAMPAVREVLKPLQ